MTVVLNWHDNPDDWTQPRSPVKCSFCGDLVSPPFVHWSCWGAKTHIRICAHCCRWVRHGLMADMMRVTAICEALNPPPDCPSLRDVQ
jgi:hypothetical protein